MSATTLAAPKEALKAFKQARKSAEVGERNYKAAVEQLKRATDIYPDFAEAWTLLGRIQLLSGNRADAADSLRRATEIDPKYLGPYPDVAYLTVAEEKWADVVRLGDEMLGINPLFTAGHYYRGIGLFKQAQLGEAEKALRDGQSTPDIAFFPEVHYMLGEVYRAQGAYVLAAQGYDRYLQVAPRGFWSEGARLWLGHLRTLGVIQAKASDGR